MTDHDRTTPLAPLPDCPKVSIVMPTFRRPHAIFDTVGTIQSQLYPHWELIVVENDQAGYCFDDPRIQVHVHAGRASASHARNRGLSHARGELVCFFDDDDDMFPEYLEELVAAFRRHPRLKLARCGMITGRYVNFSYATPECCLRREYATPTWDGQRTCEDQRYFDAIVRAHDWTEEAGDIVVITKPLCRARNDPHGGHRDGGRC
jgi:glycosyltransferase involved in cell wall biosynthesis